MIEKIVERPGEDDVMICLPELGEVMNFTGAEIRILDGYGCVVMEYPYKGRARLRLVDSDAKLNWPQTGYYITEGLPEYASGVGYLVNWDVAEVAKRMERKLDDLWLPAQPYFLDDGKRLELLGYAQIVNAEKFTHCFL